MKREVLLRGRYEIAVRVHLKPALGRRKLKKLIPTHVAALYQDRLDAGHAPASVNKLHVTLHKALDQAVKWHMVPRNVAEVVKAPRPTAKEEMRTLSAEETRRLLEAARGDRLEALYVLAATTGMRQGELLALKWQDVDLENATVSVRRTNTKSGGKLLLGEPKTNKSRRTIQLTESAVRELREHLSRQMQEIERLGDLYQDEGLIFTSEGGTLINPSNLRQRSFTHFSRGPSCPRSASTTCAIPAQRCFSPAICTPNTSRSSSATQTSPSPSTPTATLYRAWATKPRGRWRMPSAKSRLK